MAKGRVMGGGINWNATLDIREAKRKALELKSVYQDVANVAAKGLGNNKLDVKPLTGYQQAMLNLKKALADSQLQSEQLRQENLRLRNEYEKGRVSAQDYKTEISRLNLERRKEVEAARLARKAAEEVSGSYAAAQKRLKELGSEIRSTENGMKRLTPELKAKIKEYNDLNDALKKFDEKMGNHQRKVGDYRGAIRGASEDLLSFATTYLSLGNALTYVFDKTLAFQRIKTPLTFILGSEGEANNKLAELKTLAEDIGQEYFTIANSYRSFTSAARASNFDLAQSEKIFKSVTKASAVLGLSNEQLEGSLLAIQQMISKGNVQAEELRGQLSERLPGAFALAAKAMGKTEQELGNLLKTGDVLAKDLLPKLAIELDKSYGDKAADGVKGLNAELGRLKTALESGAGDNTALSKKFFEPVIVGAREAVKEIGQMFRGSFAENIRYFFTFSNKSLANQRLTYDLRDLKTNNLDAQTAAEQYKTEGKSAADLKTKYDQLNETMRKAIDAQKKFKAGVASGDLKETKDATVIEYTAIANGIIAQRNRIGQAYRELRIKENGKLKELTDQQLTSISEIRKRITELQKMSGSAIDGSEISNRIKALQARLRKPKAQGGDAEGDAAIKAQQTLQLRMDELAKTAKRKTLSDSEAEVQAVKDKYAKLFEEARIYNESVDRFNRNPKNANKTKRLRVDTGGIVRAQAYETDAVNDKVEADKLKNSLEDQKKIYEDFEQFRITFGEEKARERFKNAKDRYGDLIDLDKTYLEKLSDIQSKLQGDDKAKGSDGGSEFAEKQLKVLKDATESAKQEEQKRRDELLKEFQTYADKRLALEQAFTTKINNLKAAGKNQEAEIAKQAFQEELKNLGETHIQSLASYKKFFEDVEDLTSEELSNRLGILKKDLATIESPELKAFIEKLLKSGQATLSEKTISGYRRIASALQEASQSSEGLSAGLAEGLGIAANLAGSLINIKQSFDAFKKAQGENDALGMFGAASMGVSAILSISSFVSGIFAKAKAFREENRKVIDDFNKQRFFGEFDINQLYRERLRTQLEINKATVAGLKTNTAELKKQIVDNAADYKRIAELLSGESFITGYENKPGKDLVVRQVAILQSLAGKSFQEIEKLSMTNQLTDRAKELFAQLQKLKAEGVDIDKLLADNTKAIMEAATGTTAESIRDSIVTGFENGYRTAADFANDFKSLMNKATRQIFNEFIDNQELASFYKKYSEMAQDGALTSAQKIELKGVYDEMIKRINGKYEELKTITGDDFLKDPKTPDNSNTIRSNLTPIKEGGLTIGVNNFYHLLSTK